MSVPVDWVLDQLTSVVADQPAAHPLRRINRDTSRVFETDQAVELEVPIEERTQELEEANFVSARLATRDATAIGTEYDHQIETVVGVRIEGLSGTGGTYGHIDPAGVDGVRFADLVDDIRRAILDGRTFPDAGRSSVSFTDAQMTNESNQSADFADYYRYDFDVLFDGFETLP